MNRKILTANEVEILQQMLAGKQLKRVAIEQGRIPQNISTTVKQMMKVAGCTSHAQLGAWAERHGYARWIRSRND